MKSLVTILTVLLSLSFIGCSNFEDSSPVTPGFDKQVFSVTDQFGYYEYLQCFSAVPVNHYEESNAQDGLLEIEVLKQNWLQEYGHLFAVLEYNEDAGTSISHMLFIDKPASNEFTISDVIFEGLVDVRLFAYCLNDDLYVQAPYSYKTDFEEQEVSDWRITEGEIEIDISDFKANTGDTYVELEVKEDSFLTFVQQPDDATIVIPKFGDLEITGVKVYSNLH